MKITLSAPILGLTLAFAGAAVAQDDASFKKSDAALQKALARADVHNKRVLALLVDEGEDLAGELKKDRALSRVLRYEFEVVQFAGKGADAMAATWKFPGAVQSKPAMVVLDSASKILARIDGAGVVGDSERLLAKLKPYHCEPVDAEKKLAAALVEAKKTGRSVFIRFDAPW